MISLYACGDFSKIEIGKFSTCLKEAKNKFLVFVEKNKLIPWKTEEFEDKIVIRFQIDDSTTQDKLKNLINNLAKVTTLHGKPPVKYYLVKDPVLNDGEYLQTNSYCG